MAMAALSDSDWFSVLSDSIIIVSCAMEVGGNGSSCSMVMAGETVSCTIG